MPYLIKKLITPNLNNDVSEDEVYHSLRKQLAQHALLHLKTNYSEQLNKQPALQQMALKWEHSSSPTTDEQMAKECKIIYLDILNQQRQWLLNKNKAEKTLDEDIIRKHMQHLDLEEEKLKFV